MRCVVCLFGEVGEWGEGKEKKVGVVISGLYLKRLAPSHPTTGVAVYRSGVQAPGIRVGQWHAQK